MKKIITLIILTITIISTIIIYNTNTQEEKEEEKTYDRILYSWHMSTITNDKEKFENIIKDYDINIIYQDFTKEFLEKKDDTFIKEMKNKNIKVYHLGGDPSWGKKEGFEKIKLEIDRVIEFNKMATNKIVGIVLDIEPYISEKEEILQKEDFQIYVEEIKKAYTYTKENKLEMILAIPYWFETIDKKLLEEVVKNTDEISVMNYKITKTSKNIQEEIELAKKYQKKINTIYEVNYEDEGYFKSKTSIIRDYKKIKENNKCENLGIAYHHYDSM